uniref:Photosystem I reaction center subunit III n=1 Tax=Glaucocystis incrassata TaxID=1789788 RepID=A0A3G1IVD5_9EUKA|nr:photosystem I subunit III [Glaucocystis incrassata]ASQ40001.1 photosystem I subunit III [Glaucocystis incrassata]
MRQTLLLILAMPVLLAFLLTNSQPANADISGLVPCRDSAAFNKRLTNTTQKLQNRLKKYEAGTLPAQALQQQIEKTQKRFDRYSNLLCGSDGLPHLITDGRWTHAGDFTIPGLLFLYVAGLIGWSGRNYLQSVSALENSTEKEIIIDVPLALQSITKSLVWPLAAVQELTTGKLTNSEKEVTISPR